jgi:ABC-type bacteriocin/lantibiotic exporter with double-glycine peptidase domain
MSRSDVEQLDRNLYKVSLDSFPVAEQDTDYSCWAACAEMVLDFLGHDTTQKEIIRKIKGDASPDQASPGTGLEIMRALAGDWTHVHYDSGDSALMAIDLADGWPVILAIDTGEDIGHAVVLTGMTISWQSRPGAPSLAIVHKVEVCDPTPGVGRDRWSAEEFAEKLDGAIHMRDASRASYPGM